MPRSSLSRLSRRVSFISAAREGAGELEKRLPMVLVLELAEIRMTSRSLRWRGCRWLSSCVDMSS